LYFACYINEGLYFLYFACYTIYFICVRGRRGRERDRMVDGECFWRTWKIITKN